MIITFRQQSTRERLSISFLAPQRLRFLKNLMQSRTKQHYLEVHHLVTKHRGRGQGWIYFPLIDVSNIKIIHTILTFKTGY